MDLENEKDDSPKARQILDGARSAFRELGYEGASVDEITRRAGVSKPTLYSYFADKRELFIAFVRRECREQAERLFSLPGMDGEISETLRALGHNYLRFQLSPFAQGIFRLVVAEAQRFPELGRTFYQSGPAVGAVKLREILDAAVARGELIVPDTVLAAHQFSELCRAELFYQHLFCGGDADAVAEEQIERIVEGAVNLFMRAYGTRSQGGQAADHALSIPPDRST